jgi:hypothetical protein
MSKPTIIFTNFFDCQNIFRFGGFTYLLKDKLLFIDVKEDNSKVYSLSLFVPELNLPNIKEIEILPILCPTIKNYSNLKSSVINGDIASFRKQYYAVLASRKNKIIRFIDSLRENHVYFICTLENTSFGCFSIRKWIYETLSSGKVKDKALYIYRDGIFQDQVYGKDNGNRVDRGHNVNPMFSVDNVRGLNNYNARYFPLHPEIEAVPIIPVNNAFESLDPNLTIGMELRTVRLSAISDMTGNTPNAGGDWFDDVSDEISERYADSPNRVPVRRVPPRRVTENRVTEMLPMHPEYPEDSEEFEDLFSNPDIEIPF